MSDLNSLEARLDAAFEVIEARLASGSAGDGDGMAEARARISDLEQENRDLANTLETLNSERAKDLEQLDKLISQLRPLVEEAS